MISSSFPFAPVKNGDCLAGGVFSRWSFVLSIELDRLWCTGLNGDDKSSNDVGLNDEHVSLGLYGGGMSSCGS